jgi:SAM-dependent methyltransferase
MTDYALRLGGAELRRYELMAEAAADEEGADWARAGIVPGARVIDVGCGPGVVLALLASAVGLGGRATGVDLDPDAVAHAGRRVAGLPQAATRVGAADATGLPPGEADVVMCRHVLAHNGGREAAIVGHLASLARPGGAVYLVDVDLTGQRILPDVQLDLLDRYVAFQRRRGNDMAIGLRLGTLLGEAGLTVERFRCASRVRRVPPGARPPHWAARDAMRDAGMADDADIARWAAALERTDALDPRPWIFTPLFVAIGRRAV